MNHIITAFVFFVLSIILHLLYCRQAPVGALQAKVFILIALANGAAMTILFLLLASSDMDLPYTAAILYVLAIPAYLIFYVTTSLVSPSKKILRTIQNGSGTYDAILQSLQQEDLITLRLGELKDSKCVLYEGGRFVLTPAGKNIALFIRSYQKLLKHDSGG